MIKLLDLKLKKSDLKGFTLIELFAVIFIIGIVSLVVIPALRSYRPDLELSSAAQDLIGDLRYVQQMTITEQVKYGINFLLVEKKYQLIKYGSTEEIIKEKNLPQSVSFHSISGLTGDKIIFNPYGAVEEGGVVSFINNKGVIKNIDIRPSGFVKIID